MPKTQLVGGLQLIIFAKVSDGVFQDEHGWSIIGIDQARMCNKRDIFIP